MNTKIKHHLIAVATKNNWPTDDETLLEILFEANEVYTKKVSNSRWWYTEFVVADVEGVLIGYEYARANRDEHVRDLGWEFDESTICEVEAVQETITVYKRVNPGSGQSAINNMLLDPNTQQAEEVKDQTTQEVAAVESDAQEKAMESEETEG